MSKGIADLITALEEKRDALECLQAILKEENALITGLDCEGLRINTSRKLQVIERITDLNDRCRTALANTCEEVGVSGEITLSPLVVGLKQPEQGIIRTLQKTILGLARKNEQLLKLNKSLLDSSLCLVERSIRFFAKFLTGSGTYGQAGRMTEASVGARLVCKEM